MFYTAIKRTRVKKFITKFLTYKLPYKQILGSFIMQFYQGGGAENSRAAVSSFVFVKFVTFISEKRKSKESWILLMNIKHVK